MDVPSQLHVRKVSIMPLNNILDQQINSNMVILSIVDKVHSTGTICYGLGDRWYCLVIGGIVSSVVILAGKSSFQKIEVPYRPLLISITPSSLSPTSPSHIPPRLPL